MNGHKSGFKAGSNPYTFVGSPDPGSGVRFVPAEELIEKLKNDPKFREAVNRIEKHDFGGKPSAIKQLVRKELVNDLATRLRYNSNKKVIDYAMKKEKGKV